MLKSIFLKSVYASVAIFACVFLAGCGDSFESDYGSSAKLQKEDASKTNDCSALIDPYCEREVPTSDVAEHVVNVVQSATSIEQGKPFPGCGSTNDNQVLQVRCYDSTSVKYMCMGSIRRWTIFPNSKACPENNNVLVSSSSINMSSAVSVVSPESVLRAKMTDARDGKSYEAVVIGSQVWMAENLNYEVDNSYCYNNSVDSCAKYGRLYTWAAAVGMPEEECGKGNECGLKGVVRGVCPEGWHLPDLNEWEALYLAMGKDSHAMRAKVWTTTWESATDAYWFSALPAGGYFDSFSGIGSYAYFWSSTEGHNLNIAMYWTIYSREAIPDGNYKNYGLSVRCLKDEAYYQESSQPSAKSSSSFETPSSSGSMVKACKTETEDNCEYGLLTDARDRKTYKTVKIGEQVWMAENLNYKVEESYCYNKSADSCAKYGQLYRWTAAVDEKECGRKKCGLSGRVRGVCPEGWHLPDSSEWNTLYSTIGKNRYAMQAKRVKRWPDATDAYGFSALPAGEMSVTLQYDYIGSDAYFWSATESFGDDAYCWYISKVGASLNFSCDKLSGRSVRCLQDWDWAPPYIDL